MAVKQKRKQNKSASQKNRTASAASKTKAGKSSTAARYKGAGIIIFAVAIFITCITLFKGNNFGWMWVAMHDFVFGVSGVCAFLWLPVLFYVAYLCAANKTERLWVPITQMSSLILIIAGIIHIFANTCDYAGFGQMMSEVYESGVSLRGAGVLGALLGQLLYNWLGKAGAAIVLILIAFVLIMFFTHTTLDQLGGAVKGTAKNVTKKAGQVVAKRQKGLKNPRPDIDIDIGYEEEPSGEYGYEPAPGGIVAEPGDKAKKLISTMNDSRIFEDNLYEDTSVSEEEFSLPIQEESVPQEINVQGNAEGTVQKSASEKKADDKSAREEIEKELDEANSAEHNVYRFPPVSLLDKPKRSSAAGGAELQNTGKRLVETLKSFGVETKIVDISRGPSVTRYELQPSVGVKISKITNLADDIALNLATSGVRIEAPIPNKAAVGIEVPNKTTSIVTTYEIINSPQFANAKSKLTVALGRDIAGNITVTDIGKMPHLLIAGSTGSGKSVCINSIIISILYKASPDEVKLLMIDPKVVELGIYNGIPHLLVPVVTDARKAAGALGWAVAEMLNRYNIFAQYNVRDHDSYNRLAEKTEGLSKIPKIVIIIDELADLMMAASNEVEDYICRLAQMARAAGMHLIIATQRPSVDVITGVIKMNIPSRIAFAVSSGVDSRTILDSTGAEKLLGRGDMLFSPVGSTKASRVQGCFVSDTEIESVIEYIKKDRETSYDETIAEEIERKAAAEKGAKGDADDDDGDEMLPSAIECVVEAGTASTSLLQRRLKLGYARAARIMDQMEQRGIIGPFEGSKPRQVLITKQQWLEMQSGMPEE